MEKKYLEREKEKQKREQIRMQNKMKDRQVEEDDFIEHSDDDALRH